MATRCFLLRVRAAAVVVVILTTAGGALGGFDGLSTASRVWRLKLRPHLRAKIADKLLCAVPRASSEAALGDIRTAAGGSAAELRARGPAASATMSSSRSAVNDGLCAGMKSVHLMIISAKTGGTCGRMSSAKPRSERCGHRKREDGGVEGRGKEGGEKG